MDATGVEAFVHLMPDTPRTQIERGLAAMLQVSDRELPHALQDVGDELAFQLVMHPNLQDATSNSPHVRPHAELRGRLVVGECRLCTR